MKTLSQRLKYARELRGLTQEQLHQASGVTQATISKIERDDQKKTTFATLLATALRVRTEWLAEGIEPMERDDNNDSIKEEPNHYTPKLPPEVEHALSALRGLDEEEMAIVIQAINLVMKARRLRETARQKATEPS